MSGFYAYLVARGDAGVDANPVPRGLATRKGGGRQTRTVPLVRVRKRLPQILSPAEVDALFGALRTARDRAMQSAGIGLETPAGRGEDAGPEAGGR